MLLGTFSLGIRRKQDGSKVLEAEIIADAPMTWQHPRPLTPQKKPSYTHIGNTVADDV